VPLFEYPLAPAHLVRLGAAGLLITALIAGHLHPPFGGVLHFIDQTVHEYPSKRGCEHEEAGFQHQVYPTLVLIVDVFAVSAYEIIPLAEWLCGDLLPVGQDIAEIIEVVEYVPNTRAGLHVERSDGRKYVLVEPKESADPPQKGAYLASHEQHVEGHDEHQRAEGHVADLRAVAQQ